MSSPSSRMRPAEGRSTPVSRLMTVVLPAPLGPIRAWRAPFSMLSATPLTAAMPPKCFSRPMVSSTTGMGSASFARRDCDGCTWNESAGDASGERAHAAGPEADALAPDQHDRDQQEADPELPVLRGQVGDPVLHQLEDDGTDQPAIEIAGAADDEHEQQVGGALEGEHI